MILQETHLEKEVCDSFKLPGYNQISQSPIVSKFGGLTIFLRDDILFTEKNIGNVSKLWEGQFIELDYKIIQSKYSC